MTDVCITYVCVRDLLPAPRNARKHSTKQIRKLAKIIREFGFLVPILVTTDKRIVAGHGRIDAAKQLGMTHVPAINVEHLTPPQIEALALAENRIGDESSFSLDVVSEIVRDLASSVDFDLTMTAFDTAELDLILIEPGDEDDDALEPLLPTDGPAVSRVGDIFEIGVHRVICGDACGDATYLALMGRDRARASIDDLPYNRKINGHVSGSGRHAEFPMASGEMKPAEFTTFITAVSTQLKAYSVNGSLHYLFMDHGHIRELIDGTGPVFGQHINMCVWVKSNAGLGSYYRSRHELIFVFKASSASHVNNVELGKNGRHRTNVWEYGGANSFGKARDQMLAQHPTTKHVGMIADAIRDCTNRDDIVLDAFLGSGTTLVACERTGRRCRGIELDPRYVDLIVQRAERLLGLPAIHVASGLTFDALANARRNPGWEAVA